MEVNVGRLIEGAESDDERYIIDITNGFPVDSASDLHALMRDLFRKHNQINRFPIVATRESVYTILDLSPKPRQQHKEIINLLGIDDSEVTWTSSIENVSPNPHHMPHLDLDLGDGNHKQMVVGTGADAMAGRNLPGMGAEGDAKMKEIFGSIPGVTPHW